MSSTFVPCYWYYRGIYVLDHTIIVIYRNASC